MVAVGASFQASIEDCSIWLPLVVGNTVFNKINQESKSINENLGLVV